MIALLHRRGESLDGESKRGQADGGVVLLRLERMISRGWWLVEGGLES